MRERLTRLIPTTAARVLVTTFHGFGYRILREQGERIGLPEGFRVASEAERRALVCAKLKLSEHKAGKLLKNISEWKRTACPTEEDRLAFAAYEHAMRKSGWLDFDDLIVLPVQFFEQNADALAYYRDRFRHVLVDEFQDIDERQYRLIQLLVPPGGNLCAIGDPDQSIYSFRGGEPRFFQQFAADFPAGRTVQLRRNYRSGRAIVQGALQAIAPATLVEGRVLEALNTDATRITIHESRTDRAEAEFVVHTVEKLIGGHTFFSIDSSRVTANESRADYSFSDFALLYRTDAQAGVLCEAFARSGISFQHHTHTPLCEHPTVPAILEAARDLPTDQSVANRLRVAVGRTSTEAVETGVLTQIFAALESLAACCGHDFARFESELSLLSDVDLWDPRADRVSLLTLHASKGLEFPVVFVAGCEDGLLPLSFGSGDDANVDEERRLFFVGMTRARERLFMSHAKKRFWRGQLRQQDVSPFVTTIERELLELSKAEFKPQEKPDAEQMDLFGV